MTTILGGPPAEKVNILFKLSSFLDAPTISMIHPQQPEIHPRSMLPELRFLAINPHC